LSRWGREADLAGGKVLSTTFIIVDRLPKTGKTEAAAARIDAEIIQMSMQYWVRDLARTLGARFGIEHQLQRLDNGEVGPYLEVRLATIAVQDFLSGVSTEALIEEAEQESEEECPDEEL
jgi:hypothetical protein